MQTVHCFRNCLLRTLRHCALILEFVTSKGVEVRFHGRGKNEASHYCGQCEVVIFYSQYPLHFLCFAQEPCMSIINFTFGMLHNVHK